MKNATLVLAQEHSHLSSALDAFGLLLDRATIQDELDAPAIAPFLSFFETYVDRLHQDKEERVLFPRLRERSLKNAQAFEKLADDHHLERARLDGMRECLEGAAYGDGLSLDAFVLNARAYLKLQRSHLRHENRWLLPLAERLLTREDDLEVCAGFRDLERELGTCFVRAARKVVASLHNSDRQIAG